MKHSRWELSTEAHLPSLWRLQLGKIHPTKEASLALRNAFSLGTSGLNFFFFFFFLNVLHIFLHYLHLSEIIKKKSPIAPLVCSLCTSQNWVPSSPLCLTLTKISQHILYRFSKQLPAGANKSHYFFILLHFLRWIYTRCWIVSIFFLPLLHGKGVKGHIT